MRTVVSSFSICRCDFCLRWQEKIEFMPFSHVATFGSLLLKNASLNNVIEFIRISEQYASAEGINLAVIEHDRALSASSSYTVITMLSYQSFLVRR